MRSAPDPEEWRHHLDAARQEIDEGTFAEARTRISAAKLAGAPADEVDSLLREIEAQEALTGSSLGQRLFGAYCLGAVSYLFLSITNPFKLGPLWYVISLLLVPILAGTMAGTSVAKPADPMKRFSRGAIVAGAMMGLFSFVNVILARRGMSTPLDTGQLVIIAFVASSGYGLVAALVGGLAGRQLGEKFS